MIDVEFEYEAHGAIAEALDAAGVDDHVPTHGNADVDAGEASVSPRP